MFYLPVLSPFPDRLKGTEGESHVFIYIALASSGLWSYAAVCVAAFAASLSTHLLFNVAEKQTLIELAKY